MTDITQPQPPSNQQTPPNRQATATNARASAQADGASQNAAPTQQPDGGGLKDISQNLLGQFNQIASQFSPVLSVISQNRLVRQISQNFSFSRLLLPVGIIIIIVLLLIPMPTWLLDLTLTTSFMYSAIVLVMVLFVNKPIELSAFPTIILIAAMIRLSLNVASTRLILSEGHEGPEAAGQVIAAFGRFMAGGNYVIGMIVFGILVIINFVVITKGAGRIAEVAARFTLDAMPGKQLAIDADLSAGLIDDKEAQTRRQELDRQSNFFGSMDGASKFVRGDAIAGILITLINVVGGVIIGSFQKGLSVADAVETYTLLTVGDGLVSQIPGLVVSLAAGLLVTKSSSDGQVDKAIFSQLGGNATGLFIVSCLLFVMATLPGLPADVFSFLGVSIGVGAFFSARRARKMKSFLEAQEKQDEPQATAEEPISTTLQLDQLRLELGYSLLTLVNEGENVLTEQIRALRRQMALDFGFVMPAVRIQDNLELGGNEYIIRLKEIEIGRGTLKPGRFLVIDPKGGEISIPGEQTQEPTYGLPAVWINMNQREEAVFLGYTVVDCTTVLTTHLSELVRENMAELLSYSETSKLLNELPDHHQPLVKDLVPDKISYGALQRIFQNLLTEKISIRDMPTILEGVSEAISATQSILMISEHVRVRLARQICEANYNAEGFLELVPLSGGWEQAFSNALTGQGEEKQLSMAPSQTQDFINAIRDTFTPIENEGRQVVLMTSAYLRPYVRSILERFKPEIVVLAQSEIHSKARIRTVAVVRMKEES
ncbi:MAG: flagellar biosynthesis protein FlhA [Pseudomonadota bacterium]